MRSMMDERILNEAIAWHQALDRDDADWDVYTAWLEADPRHRRAFDEIALIDRAVDLNRDALRTILAGDGGVGRHGPRPSRRLALGAIAAALVAAVALPVLWNPPVPAVYETQIGQDRSIALGDKARVELAPSSKLLVDGSEGSSVELAAGEAYFDVRHDPANALTIKAGRYRITDIGTRFSLNVIPGGIRLGVAEGSVSIHGPAGGPITIAAGQQLVAGAAEQGGRVSRIDPSHVGSWRHGRLVYTDVPLRLIASDIERYSHQRVVIDHSLENMRFSGVLVIGDGSRLSVDLAGILGASTRVEGNSIRIGADPAN